jgi:hypothetical protein
VSDLWGDETEETETETEDFLDRADWEPPQEAFAAEPLAEPADVLEPDPVLDDATPALDEAPQAPVVEVSIDQQIANAARATPAVRSAPDPTAFSQEHLMQIAVHDPVRYAELRDQGHKLEPTRWGPDR